ncbi:nucleoside-diphosphate sugar epimerase/dehydratase [Roseibium sp. RKSG952]|uniref:polysaccharide biosynthesis protein n=1 Tax=Roseibium sp. RKSG952 TaxID=2529384 RepID=UPI0012BBBB23|nr:nucleoside-diphosphate sugar epimerase/dehydratase [Roseibium sp. RKSG952]MTI00857.1 polysaccharide biosynthesis protein [Roseibium sp. RKSG952]
MYEQELVKLKSGLEKDNLVEPEQLFAGVRPKLKQKLAELSANRRLVIGDVAASAISVVMAVVLANGGALPAQFGSVLVPLVLMSCLIALAILPMSGIYKRHTRSTSLRDVTLIVRASALSVGALALLGSAVQATAQIPLAVYFIQFLLVVPAFGTLRVLARSTELTRMTQSQSTDGDGKIPVILVGTGASCDLFVRSLRNTESKYQPVGIIDDARNTQGLYFHDVKIIGSLLDADAAIERLKYYDELPQRLLLTEPVTHFESDGIRKLTRWAEANSITVSRLTGLEELGTENNGIRTVNPEDILDRPQKAVERSMLREMFQGRRVLITGAGGSIGSELTRQIASFEPAELVMIENTEYNAYSIDMDLGQNFPDVARRIYVADIRNAGRVNAIFERHRPELVFNAAALKHVPMVELNPCEGVLTNVIGTRNVADAARNVGAIAMVQVSTDKAVNSTSVMGATKRVAEFYVQAQDRVTNETDEETRFFSVRFGNVLGSSGSLIPLFQRQISEGGPLTVTDPKMERYFMTIREAVQLTLVAAAKGLTLENSHGEIFVLDMGRPVKIVDLAERMIRLAGLVPYEDVDIKFIGIRQGEKLFEELFDVTEDHRESGIPGVASAIPEGVSAARLRAMILKLEQAAHDGNDLGVKKLLKELVPGYGANGLRPIDAKELTARPGKPNIKPVPTESLVGGFTRPDALETITAGR